MAITMKNSAFWDVTSYDQVEIYQCFGGNLLQPFLEQN